MTNESRKSGFPEFLGDAQSPEALRRQFIEAPLEAASNELLGTGAQLMNLMGMLPGAFLASQRRELRRIEAAGGKEDPRIAVLQTSIVQAETLQATAKQGQLRAQRVLAALTDQRVLFHGFVSSTELAPLEGVTVRLSAAGANDRTGFSGKTDADGYFSIVLPGRSTGAGGAAEPAGPIDLSQHIAGLMRDQGVDRGMAASAVAGDALPEGQVDILDAAGALLQRDPLPVLLDGGSIYREYVIGEAEPVSPPPARNGTADKPNSTPPAAKSAARRAKPEAPKGK